MTEKQKNELKGLAKGHWQASILRDLLTLTEVENPLRFLRGAAKRYYRRYENSFFNLLSRLKQAGINVQYNPGPRGGQWGSSYKIII